MTHSPLCGRCFGNGWNITEDYVLCIIHNALATGVFKKSLTPECLKKQTCQSNLKLILQMKGVRHKTIILYIDFLYFYISKYFIQKNIPFN